MKTVFSSAQLLHAPINEISDGKLVDAQEVPSRALMVLKQISIKDLGAVLEPQDFGLGPLRRVHSANYLQFLKEFWTLWQAEGRESEAFPYVWPVNGLRNDVEPGHIDGKLGFFSFDAGTAIGANTWQAAKASANTALTAADLVLQGEDAAFALCRPPGHHAHESFFGGYCFINNAAVAAQYLRDKGALRVSVFDLDYHHGNGTQAIFYERSDVQFLSIHADPKVEFPFFLGNADETGKGEGKGFNRNYPLPLGTQWPEWSEALEQGCAELQSFQPDYLVVSLGMDTFENDPISQFKLKAEHFTKIGQHLARLGLPTLFVMEGGYAVEDLGINCVNVLLGFEVARQDAA